MRNFKFNFILIFSLSILLFGCSNENEIVPDSLQMEQTSFEEVKPDFQNEIESRGPTLGSYPGPCFPTGGKLKPNITTEYDCQCWDFEWWNGSCYVCY